VRLTTSAKQSLIGAAVIGCLFAIFAAIAAACFDSEYGSHIYTSSHWSLSTIIVAHTIVIFVEVAGSIFVIFGIVPVCVSWLIARKNRSDNA